MGIWDSCCHLSALCGRVFIIRAMEKATTPHHTPLPAQVLAVGPSGTFVVTKGWSDTLSKILCISIQEGDINPLPNKNYEIIKCEGKYGEDEAHQFSYPKSKVAAFAALT